jgi:methylenetetrahydrofolate--tRNA-(uracil-5-)-methyltransferase
MTTMSDRSEEVTVVGAGLAGSEAAWQLAKRDIPVRLFEMRPQVSSPAHKTGEFAELVCSNSLGADVLTSPGGILKRELRRCKSLILQCADEARIPAGRALAVDRNIFSRLVTSRLESHPLIQIKRRIVEELPRGPAILATGPLTAEPLAEKIGQAVGGDFLYFFDAVSPVVTADSIDMDRSFAGSRWGRGDDYINCPMNEQEYYAFQDALSHAERAPVHEFEKDGRYFEGCLPIEVIAQRGKDTLRFGPLRPVGLEDPKTGKRPFAVAQLRQENRAKTLYNLVGFQTNLRWPEQERVFRLIPALKEAEFVRFGVMHRNLYVNAPRVLDERLRLRGREDLFLAGQIVGVEGYLESTAMGLVAALNAAALLKGRAFPEWPPETAIGALVSHLSEERPHGRFQPMNVNLGLFPPLAEKIRKRTERCQRYAERAESALAAVFPWIENE